MKSEIILNISKLPASVEMVNMGVVDVKGVYVKHGSNIDKDPDDYEVFRFSDRLRELLNFGENESKTFITIRSLMLIRLIKQWQEMNKVKVTKILVDNDLLLHGVFANMLINNNYSPMVYIKNGTHEHILEIK